VGRLDGFLFPCLRHATDVEIPVRDDLLVGLIAAVAWVVMSFQQAPVQGLLALLGALLGYFFWILYCRVALEVLAAVFRMANAIALSRGDSQLPEHAGAPVAEMVGSD